MKAFILVRFFSSEIGMNDDHIWTRKKYKNELNTVLAPEDLLQLTPLRDELLKVFSHEMIRFADEANQWENIVKSSFPKYTPIWSTVKIFIIQNRYLDDRKRKQPVVAINLDDDSLMSGEEGATAVSLAPIQRVSRKSSAPSLTYTRKSFIETSAGESKMLAFEKPSSSPAMQELDTEIADTNEVRTIVLKRCTCENRCECESVIGKYLVVSDVISSRKKEEKPPQVLVRYRPFRDRTEWPTSWIPLEVLARWKSGALLDYLISRIHFPPNATF